MKSIIESTITVLVILFQSYYSTHPKFGYQLIKKDNDSIATKSIIAKIRSYNNDSIKEAQFEGKTKINYRLLSPKINKNKKFPLVIVFHGSGAIGTDNVNQLGVLTKLWLQPYIQEKYPAFVLVPQFPVRSSNYINDVNRNVLTSKSEPCLETVFELIELLKQQLPIDSKRVYVIGFSMGGSTTINSLSLKPDLFAAGISIAGIPQFDKIDSLSNIPIWLIHGNNDTENPIDSDRQFYKEANLKNKIRFWEVENTGHNDILFSGILDDAIPKWLFLHHK